MTRCGIANVVAVLCAALAACGGDTVIEKPKEDVKSVVIEVPGDGQSLSLTVGGENGIQTVTAIVNGTQDSVFRDKPVTWKSADPAIAAVGSTDQVVNTVTGRGDGTTTIVASVKNNAGQEVKSEPVTVNVKDQTVFAVTVFPASLSLELGEMTQLTATVTNEHQKEVNDPKVLWTSDRPSIVSVTDTGMIEGHAVGAAQITAVSGGVASAPVPVTVKTDIARMVISPNPVPDLGAGESTQLTVSMTDDHDQPLTGKIVEWTSSDSSIADVSTTGVLTGYNPGKVRITAGSEGASDSVEVTVFARPAVSSMDPVEGPTGTRVTLSGDAFGAAQAGSTVSFGGTVVGSLDLVSWGENQIVVRVPASLAPGPYPVTVKVDGHPSNAEATFTVLVSAATVQLMPAPPYQLLLTDSLQLAVAVSDATGALLTGRHVEWTTSNDAIATVSANGSVTGVGEGTVTITATVQGLTAQGAVTVFRPAVVNTLSPTSGPPGTEVTINGARFGSEPGGSAVTFGNTTLVPGDILSWSDTTIVVRVPALPPGQDDVRVNVDGHPSNAVPFDVLPAAAKVTLAPKGPYALKVGETLQLSAVVEDAAGNLLPGRTVAWTVDSSAVATAVNGLLTGVALGKTKVTVQVEAITLQEEVTVYQPAQLASLSPVSGPAGSQTTLNGSAFGIGQGSSKVTFTAGGTSTTADVLFWSDTRVTVRVPRTLSVGPYAVSLAVDGRSSNSGQFTVTAAPYVLGVKPRMVPQNSQVTLTISGYNLVTNGNACAVAVFRDGAQDGDFSVANPPVVDQAGSTDTIHVSMDVGPAALGQVAVACGTSITSLNSDNALTVTGREGNIFPVAGNSVVGFAGDGASALTARLKLPQGVAAGTSGELYVADTGNNRVRVVNTNVTGNLVVAGITVPAGAIASLAGGGGLPGDVQAGSTGDGGPAVRSRLNGPVGLAFDSKRGLLFIADTGNHAIRAVNVGTGAVALPSGPLAAGAITTVAGDKAAGDAGDGLAATSAHLNGPKGVMVDADGLLYVADSGNHRVRAVNTSGELLSNALGSWSPGTIDLAVGTGVAGSGGDGGLAAVAQLSEPVGLALTKGMLLISDAGAKVVRGANTRWTSTTVLGPASVTGTLGVVVPGGSIDRLGGDPVAGAYDDVFARTNALMRTPGALSVGPFGEVFVAEPGSHAIRVLVVGDSPVWRVGRWFGAGYLATAAGAGAAGNTGDLGPAAAALLSGPQGVSFSYEQGMLYVADTGNSRIRRIRTHFPADPFSGDSGEWPQDVATGTATLNTDTGVLTYTLNGATKTVRFGPKGGLFAFSSGFEVRQGVTLNLVGAAPAVIAANGPVNVAGTIRVGAGGMTSGPGLIYDRGGGGLGFATRAGPTGYSGCDTSGSYGRPYGNFTLVPLSPAMSGGNPTGGLVLSAGTPDSAQNLVVSGFIDGNGGSVTYWGRSATGAGIRLVASGRVEVSGRIEAKAGTNGYFGSGPPCSYGANSDGIIRLEGALGVNPGGTIFPAPSTAAPISPPWL